MSSFDFLSWCVLFSLSSWDWYYNKITIKYLSYDHRGLIVSSCDLEFYEPTHLFRLRSASSTEFAGDAQWFIQTLDHLNRQDERTWKQRYFVNEKNYNATVGGPIFFILVRISYFTIFFFDSMIIITLWDWRQSDHIRFGEARVCQISSVEVSSPYHWPSALQNHWLVDFLSIHFIWDNMTNVNPREVKVMWATTTWPMNSRPTGPWIMAPSLWPWSIVSTAAVSLSRHKRLRR